MCVCGQNTKKKLYFRKYPCRCGQGQNQKSKCTAKSKPYAANRLCRFGDLFSVGFFPFQITQDADLLFIYKYSLAELYSISFSNDSHLKVHSDAPRQDSVGGVEVKQNSNWIVPGNRK